MISKLKLESEGKGQYVSDGLKNLSIDIVHSKLMKCERCWIYSDTVGQNTDNDPVCKRCYEVLKSYSKKD